VATQLLLLQSINAKHLGIVLICVWEYFKQLH